MSIEYWTLGDAQHVQIARYIYIAITTVSLAGSLTGKPLHLHFQGMDMGHCCLISV